MLLLLLFPALGLSRRHSSRRKLLRLLRQLDRNAVKEDPLPQFDWAKSKAPTDAQLTSEQKQRLELLRLVGLESLRSYFDIPVL